MNPSHISRGAKLFAKRAAADKRMTEADLGLSGFGAEGNSHPEDDEDTDSASSASIEYVDARKFNF